jgi:SAM-dependent methyltransferase
VSDPGRDDQLEALLAEQVAYYRARAPEYVQSTFEDVSESVAAAAERELLAALDAVGPVGEALELACGPGTWTARLLRQASRVTALDASPEMLELAAARVHDRRVRFIQADVFQWIPDRAYDFVFFGFWLSHVPLERFDAFWSTVAAALRPGGHVFFVDDGFRTAEELIEGPQSSTIRRRLSDGSAFRAVKVPHRPAHLEQRLIRLGWRIRVRQAAGPFFWGAGSRG